MPGVQERVAAYEAMLAKRNGSGPDPLADGLADPLAEPPASSSAPTTVEEMTPEQKLEWQIAIRQPYTGPDDLLNLPEWMRPLMAVSDETSDSSSRGREPKKKKKKATTPEARTLASVPGGSEAVPKAAKAPPTPSQIWATVPPEGRVMAAPAKVDLNHADVMYVMEQVRMSVGILASQPGMSALVPTVMQLQDQMMKLAVELQIAEVHERIDGADLITCAKQRLAVVSKMVGVLAALKGLLSSTPALLPTQRLFEWTQRNMGELTTRIAG